MKKRNNIVKFQKDYKFNIGIVIIFIIFIYVLFHVFSFLTDKDIKVYEVKEGTISASMQKDALALRNEEVFKAESVGKIKYFKQNATRVGVKSLLYSIDKTGQITNEINSINTDISKLSGNTLNGIYDEFLSFSSGYSDSNFIRTGIFKNNLSTQMDRIQTETAMLSLGDSIKQASESGDYLLNYAPKAGLFMLTVDGFEDTNIDNFDKESFNVDKVKKVSFNSNQDVNQDDAIFKLITGDKWQLVFPVSENEINQLKDEKYINIRFKQDDFTTYAASSVIHQGSEDYIKLEFDDSIERYADNRFLTIEMLLNNKSGLKIPNTAITTKEFFVIPKNYFMKGNDSNSLGLMVKKVSGNEFITPTIFYETDDAYYIDSEKVDEKDYILKPESNEEYRVDTKTDELQGVYNVNTGYAVFKQIVILNQNKEYAIVDKNTSYGISLYDRIVLDGSSVKENDMI
ncbi:MAG: hypothetical protein K5644_06965 [Lachnospiraceae bacterium]|nr:hypothetical protein [Lachnospiraceae bacterium]